MSEFLERYLGENLHSFLAEAYKPFTLSFGLLTIFSVGAVILLNYLSIEISLPSAGSLLLASATFTSVYIAWKELLHKTEAYGKIDIEKEEEEGVPVHYVTLTNTGKRVMGPTTVVYGVIRRDEEHGYYLGNHVIEGFDKKNIEEGETAKARIGENVLNLYILGVYAKNWKDESVSIEVPNHKRELNFSENMDKLESKPVSKLTMLLREAVDRDVNQGTYISKEDIENLSKEDLIEESLTYANPEKEED